MTEATPAIIFLEKPHVNKIVIASACLLAGFGVIPQAHAQKEAIGMFYEMQMAPAVCNWKDAGDSKKLDAKVADMEKALGVTAAEKATMMKAAEADLKSDPSNCAADGMIRPMYDEAVK